MTSSTLFARIPPKTMEALRAHAEEKGQTLSRATADLLTAALVSNAAPDLLPADVSAYLVGRRMFATLAGFFEATAAKPEPEPEEEPDPTVARVKLYRAKDGQGWTAAWFIDRPTPDGATESAGLVGQQWTAGFALDEAVRRIAEKL